MRNFTCWEGDAKPGWSMDFLGGRTRVGFVSGFAEQAGIFERRHLSMSYPMVNEESFEWIALLESVVEARDRYTMIELGAGYGRWLAIAALAVRQFSGLPCRLIGVEAEPLHFEWMEQHLRDNDVPGAWTKLIRAAVAPMDGDVWFHIGDAADWYGQLIAQAPPVAEEKRSFWSRARTWLSGPAPRTSTERSIVRVPAISLNTLLADERRVDFLDLDVQGVEAEVLEPAAEALDSLVRRVFIGTHSRENEERVRALFRSLGWEGVDDYASGSESETPFGRITFEDGAQTWLNPKLRFA